MEKRFSFLNQENDSAEIINGFGVVVTTIKNVKALDDVDLSFKSYSNCRSWF